MKGIIDIHNHILFGVDDGARKISDSLNIIKEEYAQGVRKIILTPHYQGGDFEASKERLQKKFEELKEAAKEQYPDVTLYLGQEILYAGDVVKMLNQGRLLALGESKYVLMEFMPSARYELLEKGVKELLLSGYIPVLAHVERYKCLRGQVGRIKHLVETGAYMQVNADIVNKFTTRRMLKLLVEEDCLHFIGSDAHNMTNRGVRFNKCIKYMSNKYGEEYVEWLLIDNPQKIIDNQYI